MVNRNLYAYSILVIKEHYQLIIEMFDMYISYATNVGGSQIRLITTMPIIIIAAHHIISYEKLGKQRRPIRVRVALWKY